MSLVARDIKRAYGSELVLNQLSLRINPGEIVLLLGANGAGKSTFLGICSGLVRSDGGLIEYNGLAAIPFKKIGYAAHEPLLYANLTVLENLRLTKELLGLSCDLNTELDRWGLEGLADKTAGALSRGKRSSLGLCRAFLAKPEYLFLDEPSNALDQTAIERVKSAIKNSAVHGATTLLATHDISSFESLATRGVLLQDGKISIDGPVDKVISAYQGVNR